MTQSCEAPVGQGGLAAFLATGAEGGLVPTSSRREREPAAPAESAQIRQEDAVPKLSYPQPALGEQEPGLPSLGSSLYCREGRWVLLLGAPEDSAVAAIGLASSLYSLIARAVS